MRQYMLYPKKLASVSLLAFLIHNLAAADSYEYLFNQPFGGSPPASSDRPWANAVFQDIAPGIVQLTVSNLNLTGTENIDELFFNLAPNLDPRKLRFTLVSSSGQFQQPSISKGANQFKVNGDGKYDILFTFSNNGQKEREFTAGEVLTYKISGIAGLTAVDFGYLSAPAGGTAGPFYAVADVQHIAPCSLYGYVAADLIVPIVPVPEPGVTSLLAFAVCLWLGLRLSRRAAKAASPQLRRIPIRPRPRR